MKKAILFDMDGVLFDSERVGREIFGALLKEEGYPNGESTFNLMLGANYDWDRRLCLSIYGESFPFERFINELHDRRTHLGETGQIPLKPGAQKCLDYIRQNRIPTAVVSGTNMDLIQTYLNSVSGMRDCFPVIISGDMNCRSKPDPEPYLRAAQSLGILPEECIGVEDSLNGVQSLHSAGITSICIPDLIPWNDAFLPHVDYRLPNLGAVPQLMEQLNGNGKSINASCSGA